MWTDEQIETAQVRAALCESVTMTRDSYLELLDTAKYENASRLRASELETALAKVAELDGTNAELVVNLDSVEVERDCFRDALEHITEECLFNNGTTIRSLVDIARAALKH